MNEDLLFDDYICDVPYSAFIIENCNMVTGLTYMDEELIPDTVQELFTLNEVLMSMEVKRKKCYLAVSMKYTNGKYGCQVFEIKPHSSIPTPGGCNLEDIVVKRAPVTTLLFVRKEEEE